VPTPANRDGAGEGAAQANGEGAAPEMTNEDWEGPSDGPSPASPSQGSGAAVGRCAGEQNRHRSSRRGGSRAAVGRWGAGPPPMEGLGRLQELAMKRSRFYLRPVKVGILYVLFARRNLREIETSSALINGWTMRWINGRAMHAATEYDIS
jgi:hypothetical protein